MKCLTNEGQIPFFLDHLQKITMVDNLLKDGAQSKAIVPTESRREAYNRDCVQKLWRDHVLVLNTRVELGKEPSIPKGGKLQPYCTSLVLFYSRRRSCMMSLINDNTLQLSRIYLCKARLRKEALIRRDGPDND